MPVAIQVKRISVSATCSTELRYTDSTNTLSACILVLPALGIAGNFYDRLLKTLAKESYPSGVIDLRGQDSSSVVADRRNNFGYMNC